MKVRMWSIQAALLISMMGVGYVAAEDKPLSAQQQKMVSCNQQAKDKAVKGAERKTFMSSCLKGQSTAAAAAPVAAAPTDMPAAHQTQQEKMKSCSADAKAKTLKGADRKTFMSGCLKGTATS